MLEKMFEFSVFLSNFSLIPFFFFVFFSSLLLIFPCPLLRV